MASLLCSVLVRRRVFLERTLDGDGDLLGFGSRHGLGLGAASHRSGVEPLAGAVGLLLLALASCRASLGDRSGARRAERLDGDRELRLRHRLLHLRLRAASGRSSVELLACAVGLLLLALAGGRASLRDGSGVRLRAAGCNNHASPCCFATLMLLGTKYIRPHQVE